MRALKPVIVLVGPTAIGKSRVAIEMAKEMGTEVLTADSRQVYCGMDIGTDKPTIEERQGVPHQLIDLVEPDQLFNVSRQGLNWKLQRACFKKPKSYSIEPILEVFGP